MGYKSHQDFTCWVNEKGLDFPLIDTTLAHLGGSKVIYTVEAMPSGDFLYLVSKS
jgi:hypothetical protein